MCVSSSVLLYKFSSDQNNSDYLYLLSVCPFLIFRALLYTQSHLLLTIIPIYRWGHRSSRGWVTYLVTLLVTDRGQRQAQTLDSKDTLMEHHHLLLRGPHVLPFIPPVANSDSLLHVRVNESENAQVLYAVAIENSLYGVLGEKRHHCRQIRHSCYRPPKLCEGNYLDFIWTEERPRDYGKL